MATVNPFDLLGDDDNDDPTQLLAAQEKKIVAKKPAPAVSGGALAAAPKMPSKPLPPSQAVREAKSNTAAPRGGGSGRGGPSRGTGGRSGGRDFGNGNANGYGGGYGGVGGGEGDNRRPLDRERRPYGGPSDREREPYSGPRQSFRGGRRGGYGNEEAGGDTERPRRTYERRSGTGSGYEVKRDGAGRGNWGTATDDALTQETEDNVNADEKIVSPEKLPVQEDAPSTEVGKEGQASDVEVKEEDKEMTLEEYEKIREEKRKALLAMKAEERKVELDNELKGMQLLSMKKENDPIFIKLGSDKEKKKENADRDEKAKKALSINEFLKPAEGERFYGPSGRGRGRGRGDRGLFRGGSSGADVGTMTRLLHECIAYQRSLDLRLDSLLSSRPDLDRHLLSLRRSSAPLLSLARSDSSLLLSSLSSTSSLADAVSSKVRLLDLAQSRVHLVLSRIDAALHRSHCLDSARNSLDIEDYASAAASVHSFLQIDSQFPSSSASDQKQQLLELKSKLESIVKSKLAAAVDRKDHPAILRFVRILPPLGLQDDGLKTYVNYLRSVIGFRSKLEFEHLKEIAAESAAGANFVGCLTNLFKDIVLAVEENDEILRDLGGEDGVVYAISSLQEECDSRGTQILRRYMEYRKVARLASEINSNSKNLLSVGEPEGPDPREVETCLEEILSLTHLGEDYTEFMVSKIRGLGSVDPEFGSKAVKKLRSGSFNGVVQDLIGYYLVLEEFFMVENVRKAIAIDEQQEDSLTTSMVDDVFFLLQSCCRRAISTGSINSVFAVLSGATSLLSHEYQEALQQKMREPNLGAKLFLGGVGVQKTGTEIATTLNNIDVSAEYVLKLRHEIEEQCGQVFPAPGDREKVKSCLSELTEVHNVFKQVLNAGMEQLGAAITPRIRPVLDTVATISYELSDAEYEENEMNDPWVQKLLHAVETNMVWLQPFMTSNNYDLFVHLVIDFIIKRLEVIMMQKRFSQLGGLQLDREVRALVNHFSEMSQRPVRDKFARLSQMSTILNFERVSEILDFWGENAGHMTWLLTPSEVRRVLGLRLDFKPEAIAALRL